MEILDHTNRITSFEHLRAGEAFKFFKNQEVWIKVVNRDNKDESKFNSIQLGNYNTCVVKDDDMVIEVEATLNLR